MRRMEFVAAKLKPNLSNQNFAAVRDMLREKLDVRDVALAKGRLHMGWVRPFAVRCISGHCNNALDVELTTIPITEKVMHAVGGAWHMTSLGSLSWCVCHSAHRQGPSA